MPTAIIQENIKSYVLYMSKYGKFEVCEFGEVVVNCTKLPSYSFIFDYSEPKAPYTDLQQVFDYAAAMQNPFMLVRSSDQDAALHEFIEQNKFKAIGEATMMTIDHAGFAMHELEHIKIQRVMDQDALLQFCNIHDQAFGMPDGTSKKWFCMTELFNPTFQAQLYMAYIEVDGELQAVGTAVLYLPLAKELLAGHYSWAVKKEFRKQGIMTYLANNMIQIAKDKGYHSSVAQCYDASARLAAEIGFKPHGTLKLFSN